MMRADIVAEARLWIGTPYRHQASLRGAGCDCLGLVRGVWRALIGAEPETPPAYTPDWAETRSEETLLHAAARHLVACPEAARGIGDVAVFRMTPGVPAKHCGILSGHGTLIHAYWGRAVAETRLVSWWERRIAGVFSYPGLED